ncbi:MAG: hypothetical protein AMXMBFR36_25910 [Acidobacteriota bacterium]
MRLLFLPTIVLLLASCASATQVPVVRVGKRLQAESLTRERVDLLEELRSFLERERSKEKGGLAWFRVEEVSEEDAGVVVVSGCAAFGKLELKRNKAAAIFVRTSSGWNWHSLEVLRADLHSPPLRCW